MKKSEMVHSIIAPMISAIKIGKNKTSPIMYADLILNAIERNGMLPPVNPEAVTGNYYSGLACYHEWEPENE